MYPRLVLNSCRDLPASTYLQSAGTKGMCIHAWLFKIYLFYLYRCFACMYVHHIHALLL